MEEKQSFMEYMCQEKLVSRWFILRLALLGMFAGTIFATAYFLGALVP
jgi:hypothetical protein